MILGVDPGTTQSAWVVFDPKTQTICSMGIEANESFLAALRISNPSIHVFAIEHIASFGFTVGQEVMETLRWEGRFEEAMRRQSVIMYPVRRKQVVAHHCGSVKGNDSAVRKAMIDRFGNDTGCTYDLWSALAIASCASDHLGLHKSSCPVGQCTAK